MRGDKSFAYDLFVPHRRVSSRVVLLLRSTERKRSRPRFVDYNLPLTYGLVPGVEGGWIGSACDVLPGRSAVRGWVPGRLREPGRHSALPRCGTVLGAASPTSASLPAEGVGWRLKGSGGSAG